MALSKYTNDDALNRLLTPDQVADLLGVAKGTLAVWRCSGRYQLAFVKIGGRVRYRAGDIQAFIERRLRNHT